MTDIYIEDFNRDVAIALTRLYQYFPRPAAIYVDEIAGSDDPDEYGVISERHSRCLGALVWLGDEGFLRFRDTIGIEAIDQAVLSLRGYQALNSGIDGGERLIDALRASLRERNSEATKRHISALFTAFLAGVTMPPPRH